MMTHEEANEPRVGAVAHSTPAVEEAATEVRRRSAQLFGHSLHIRTVDTGSCGACESELKLLSSPRYDFHRLGFFFAPAPRHADCLMVTGPGTLAMDHALMATYEAMPDPKIVVAVGACPMGGVFGPDAYTHGDLAAQLPVDVYIPGCPPSPLALLQGLLLALDRGRARMPGKPEPEA